MATQVGSSQEKRGASGKAAGVNNVKAEPVQCNRVVIEARNQPGTNFVGARPAQDIPKIRIPDSSVYRVADQICEEIARKQANNADETSVKGVVDALDDSNAGNVATDELAIRLVNKIDFSMKGGVAFLIQDAFLDKMDLANCKQTLQLSELQYCNVLMKTECGVKSVRCLKDSGAQISLIQKDLIKDVDVQVLGTMTIKGVIGQPAEAALVTLKIKPATSEDLENIALYIDLCFAACEITRDLEAILCAANLEKLDDVSAYDVLKPTVVTESDVIVRKCMLGDKNDIDVVNHNDNVTRSHDTLLGNAEIVTDDKDAQIESKACNANNMSDDDPVSLDPVSRDVRDKNDVLRDEQRADPTSERAQVLAQKTKITSL